MNPFDDVERTVSETIRRQLDQAEALDHMEDVDVTSWEAEFLDSVLKQLRAGRALSQKQIDVLNRMSSQYGVG